MPAATEPGTEAEEPVKVTSTEGGDQPDRAPEEASDLVGAVVLAA
ncbi:MULTISPECIES: hypothetical protein [Streptomycetaceae]|uniref:Uncharacterized protein n=1 Tax=Streptantibioticus cattleyicolor (strain ATCC 35852 / DSM 46488 / JCM 4925 / NBRC 14057 / NRRL 8057) TaxID=1003195 RepID=G8WP54_STREN|nr:MULTISPECIES: hypothetical protein [Streptomycetaceae]AEW94087.1 hypothetical protein SCATT_17160 [Streptantibioticus cattleyicolor NRRL 8057 = DSM 46488]